MADRPLPIYKTRRLVPVTFRRARTGPPSAERPDVDERGFTGTEHGPLIGICQGDTAIVEVVREQLKSTAPLFASSTDPAVADVVGAQLGTGASTELRIRGVLGGNPKVAVIRIHFGAVGGPVVGQLGVWVHAPISLRVKPHIVSVTTAADRALVPPVAPIAPTNNVAHVIEGVRRIWRPLGIELTVLPDATHTVDMSVAGQVKFGEMGGLFATYNTPAPAGGIGPPTPPLPKTIHIYFVHHTDDGYFGFGISPAIAAAHTYPGIHDPGILLADEAKGGYALDAELQWAMVAHEIGHFLTLWHPEKQDANAPRQDFWSRRMLMFPVLPVTPMRDWRDKLGYGTFQFPPPFHGNAPKNGALITMKNLAQLITDGEATDARMAAVNLP